MFLQITDKHAISIDKIVSVWFSRSDKIAITLDCQDGDTSLYYELDGEDAKKFKQWWEEKADVYKL